MMLQLKHHAGLSLRSASAKRLQTSPVVSYGSGARVSTRIAKLVVKAAETTETAPAAPVKQNVEQRQARETSVETPKAGSVIECEVVKVMPYGVFARMPNGDTGLLHMRQISKELVGEISRAGLAVGDKFKAMVLTVTRVRGNDVVALSTRHLEKTPGDMLHNKQAVYESAEAMAEAYQAAAPQRIAERLKDFEGLKVGEVLTAKVRGVRPAGVMVQFPGIERSTLLHRRQWGSARPKVGQEVKVLVESMNKETGRINITARYKQQEDGTYVAVPPEQRGRRQGEASDEQTQSS